MATVYILALLLCAPQTHPLPHIIVRLLQSYKHHKHHFILLSHLLYYLLHCKYLI